MYVGKREKKGEGSAWTLCSGLPSREKVVRGWRAWARPHGDSAARPLKGGNHEIHEIHERDNNRTTNGHEWTRITSIHETVSLIMYNFRVFRAFRG